MLYHREQGSRIVSSAQEDAALIAEGWFHNPSFQPDLSAASAESIEEPPKAFKYQPGEVVKRKPGRPPKTTSEK